jgi:hypothetical protein
MVTVRVVDRMVLEERGSNLFVKDLDVSAKGDEDTIVLEFGRKEMRHAFCTKNAASVRIGRRSRALGARRRRLRFTRRR